MKKLGIGIFLLIGLAYWIQSCSKTVEPVWMEYNEEGCLPPWAAKADYKSRNNLEAVLRSDGIIPLRIKIKGDRDNSCESCDCRTGKTYHVQVDESQISWMFYYGFSLES